MDCKYLCSNFFYRKLLGDSDADMSGAVPELSTGSPDTSVILSPFSFAVSLTRNLSSWYRGIPQVDVEADIATLKVKDSCTAMYVCEIYSTHNVYE